jgi:hypothetical protein
MNHTRDTSTLEKIRVRVYTQNAQHRTTMWSTCIIAVLMIQLAHGDIMSIGNNMYPYVALLDPVIPVKWHTKFFAQRMAASQAVRINPRGIRFISSQYSVLTVNSIGDRWLKVDCTSSTDCLCVLKTGTNLNARLFPIANQVYSSFGKHEGLGDAMEQILFSKCSESQTFITVSTNYKDISVCDILGTGNDYLFIPQDEVLYVLMHPTPIPILVSQPYLFCLNPKPYLFW